MTLCRFFQQGCCRYGNNCKFEHSSPYKYTNYVAQPTQQHPNQPAAPNVTTEQLFNQVINDTNAAIVGRQWVLSSYAPFKSKPNFPGMNDISPEEVAFQMYEAKLNGTTLQIENHIKQLQVEALEKFKCLLKPTREVASVIESLYRNENPADPFVSQSMAFPQNANPFGNVQPQAPANNIFGGAAQNTNASSLFANAAQNLFQAPAATNVFGNQQTNTFGQNNAFPTQMESGVNNSSFSVFGQQQTNTFALPNNEPISYPNNTFAQPNVPVFGNTLPAPQPNVSNNLFGQAQEVTATSLFASANANLAPSTPVNIFGQPTSTQPVQQNQNPFNAQPTSSDPFQKPFSSNVFDKPNTGFFGGSEINSIIEDVYSKLEELTEEELNAFKSDHFEAGMIPEVPPPLELCSR